MASFTWQGEFASTLREKRYRLTHWPATALRMRFFCGFTSVVYLALSLADHNALGASAAFYALLSLRLTCFALGWSCVVLSFSKRFMELLPWTVACYMLALGCTEAAQAMLYAQAPQDWQLLFTLCLVLTYYMFTPPALAPGIVGAVGASTIYVLAVLLFEQPPPGRQLFISLFFLLINVYGVYFLRSSHMASRRQFHALREERLLGRRLRRETTERRKAQAQLQLLATTDDLTGLFNRRRFLAMCKHELLRFARYGQPVSLLLLDVDHLKYVNETHGHDMGDEFLQQLASRCANLLRTTDMPGRLGGEEFGMLLPCTSLNDAMMVAERIRQAVEERPVKINGLALEATVSIGVAEAVTHVDTPQALLHLAEQTLNLAKQRGCNQVCSTADLPAQKRPENEEEEAPTHH